ncbi:membrane bound O-acyl transferase family-domain-containing protein, partial [Pisolithus microcarpus]
AVGMVVSRTGTGHSDYSFGTTLGAFVLDAIRFLLMIRPLEEYRHETDKVPAYQLPYSRRFFWLMSIPLRGIGWSFKVIEIANHSVPSVEPHHLTRRAFVASRLYRVFAYYILFEVVQLYMHCNPIFLSEAPLLSQGYFLGWLNIMAIPLRIYTSLNWMYSLVAMIAVGTTLHEPRSWPAPFGKWKDAYTIRRFWGRTWHQFARHHKSRPWDCASSLLDAKTKDREPWLMSYTRLCNAFLCSAFMHTCGDIVNHPNVIGFSIPFFLLQPVGVLVEDVVMEAGKHIGLKKTGWSKVVGYLWVSLWISYSV